MTLVTPLIHPVMLALMPPASPPLMIPCAPLALAAVVPKVLGWRGDGRLLRRESSENCRWTWRSILLALQVGHVPTSLVLVLLALRLGHVLLALRLGHVLATQPLPRMHAGHQQAIELQRQSCCTQPPLLQEL